MPLELLFGIVIAAFVLAVIFWRVKRTPQASRRNLAMALVAEIQTVVDTLHSQDPAAALSQAMFSEEGALTLRDIQLPPFGVYQTNRKALGIFGASLSIKITHLYERWAALPGKLTDLKDFWAHSGMGRGSYTWHLVEEITQTERLADDVLIALRMALSRHGEDGGRKTLPVRRARERRGISMSQR